MNDSELPPEVAYRYELNEQFPVPATAFSADGRVAHLTGPLTMGVNVGGFAVIAPPDRGGELVVVQVRDLQVIDRDGPTVGFDGAEHVGRVGATLTTTFRALRGEGTVLGTMIGEEFAPATPVAPFGEAFVRPASDAETRVVREVSDERSPTMTIGVLRDAPTVPARLRTEGFSRHTFMCGQSGSGKTYTTGVLFERLLLETSLPMVVIDPNSDHVHLGSLRDGDDPSPEAERYRSVAGAVTTVRARGLDGTHTLCVDFSDLVPEVRALLLRLHPIADLDEFNALERTCETLDAPYSVLDVAAAAAQQPDTAAIARRIANLRLDEWGLWRRNGETSVVQTNPHDERCLVIDTGSLATPGERHTVGLAVLGRRWANRRARIPTLLAIDEAHNVLPSSTDDPLLQASTELGTLIAGEGRKFGLHLFVASQRPVKVHPNVLSQCDNLVLMRMNGADDVAELEKLFSHVRPMLLRESLSFGLGQALFAGKIAPVPLLTSVGGRLSEEGGADIATTWAQPPS